MVATQRNSKNRQAHDIKESRGGLRLQGEAGKAPDPLPVKVSVEVITPDIAAEMLSHNTKNFRKLSESRARALADVMTRGHFRFNGEKIHIRSDGTIADGQTRLKACVLSGVPFRTVVVRGDVEDESNIDTGSKRTTGQLLQAYGIANANSTAAAVKAVIALFERNTMSHLTYVAPIAASEVKEWLDKHPQMSESVKVAADSPIGIFQALVAAIHFQGMGLDAKHTEWWIKALITGQDSSTGKDLTENDPVLRLRNRFRVGGKRVMLSRIEQAALLIKSWNLSKWGKPVKSVTWRGSGPNPEDFPILGAPEPTEAAPAPTTAPTVTMNVPAQTAAARA